MGRKNTVNQEYNDDYFNLLKCGWLDEDKDQIHMGGWKFTKNTLGKLRLNKNSYVLDICCGEGATLNWLYEKFGIKGTGIDKNKSSISFAKNNYPSTIEYKSIDLYNYKIERNKYDLIFGQDPDALGSYKRQVLFDNFFLGLKKDGIFIFNHWVPYIGCEEKQKKEFDKINIKAGYKSHINLNSDAYLLGLKKAGFKKIEIKNLSKGYENYYQKLLASYKKNKIDYSWLQDWLNFNKTSPAGVLFKCIK